MDMVTSMLSYFSLPLSLWMYALKIFMYLLNRVVGKALACLGLSSKSKDL